MPSNPGWRWNFGLLRGDEAVDGELPSLMYITAHLGARVVNDFTLLSVWL